MILARHKPLGVPRLPVLFLLAALAFNLSACATSVTPPVAVPGPSQPWQASELISALTQRDQQVRSMRALARVDYAGPEGKHNFQEAVVVQRPNQLRLETLTFIGAILIVTVNQQEIIGYHPREGIMLRGPSSKENLLRFTQLPLELNEVTTLLAGLPPVNAGALARQDGNALLFEAKGGKRDRVAFESQQAVPTLWERFNGAGEVELATRFSDYTQGSAGLFASRIMVDAPLLKKKLEIRLEEPEFNGAIAAELFTQQKPEHVKEYRIEAIGG